MLQTENSPFTGRQCDLEGEGQCITCSDEALPARVLQVDQALALAQVEIEGVVTEVDISLVDEVAPGHLLLIHGGVALEHLGKVS